MNIPLMKCGCAGFATCSRMNGVEYDPAIPACVTHDCIEIAQEQPDLSGRMATCDYGDTVKPSSVSELAFFVYQPDKPTDKFYCGCHGWD